MPAKISIPDQAYVQDRLETLTADATRLEKLAGATAPARPKVSGDELQDWEALEAHVAVLSVVTRLRQSPPPAPVAPRIIAAPALAPASKVSGAAISKPAGKLTATQRATAALAALPRTTPAKAAAAAPEAIAAPAVKLSATERCLAVKAKPAASAPVKLSASEKCRLAIAAQAAAKAAKTITVPAVTGNPNAPRV